MAARIERPDRAMEAAKNIVNSLNTSSDAILIFSNFDDRFSNITNLMRFESAEKTILRWDTTAFSPHQPSLYWEDSPENASDFLNAVDDILNLTSDDPDINSDSDLMDRAHSAIQSAMTRLEDEFRHIIVRNTIPFNPDTALINDFNSFEEAEEENDDDLDNHQSPDNRDDLCLDNSELFVDVINPDCIDELKSIADKMIRAGYEKECCQVYISVRRDVLDEFMSILGVEKLSIDEVQKIEWRALDEKMKKWIQAVKVVIRVLLTGEKRLCKELFEGLDSEACFAETTKGCVIQLLNFGEAVAIGRRSPEKLFRILDMYDLLVSVLPDLKSLFCDELGEVVLSEADGVMIGLGDAAVGTFAEFENAVEGEDSKKPTLNGEIHPLTRYVMNYVKLLVDYSDSLNVLLENSADVVELSDCLLREGIDNLRLEDVSPFALRLLLLIKTLQSNLEEKSKMYEDNGMQYIFLMNNLLYVVQKVKGSELGEVLGDPWVRKRRGQIRQYATSYLRASWSKALTCLKDIEVGGSSSNAFKVALKERFKNFNAAFEDIYRIQSAWKVPDAQLREELRISISEKVLPAYRAFLGRFGNQIEIERHVGKHMKYTPEDLEGYLSDLFEGTPTVLHHVRRKNT